MENEQIKVNQKSEYWLTLVIVTFLILFFSYKVYSNASLIFRLLYLGADLYFLILLFYYIANTINKITFDDTLITIHKVLLKDIIIDKDNLVSISNKHIRVTGKVINTSYIADKEKLLGGLVRLLTDRDFDEAFKEINNGTVIYKSRDILEEAEKKQHKKMNLTYIFLFVVYAALFIFLVGGFVINMFSNHWSLPQAIGGILFWIFAFVLLIFDKSKKSNNGLYIAFKLALSVVLCIAVAFVISKVFLLIGINLNNFKL